MMASSKATPELLYGYLTNLEGLFFDLESQIRRTQRNFRSGFVAALSAGIESLHKYRTCLINVTSAFLNCKVPCGNEDDISAALRQQMVDIFHFCAPRLKHIYIPHQFTSDRVFDACLWGEMESLGITPFDPLTILTNETPKLTRLLMSGFQDLEEGWAAVASLARPQLRAIIIECVIPGMDWRCVVGWINTIAKSSPLLRKVEFASGSGWTSSGEVVSVRSQVWSAILGEKVEDCSHDARNLCLRTTGLPLSSFVVQNEQLWTFVISSGYPIDEKHSEDLWNSCEMDGALLEAVNCFAGSTDVRCRPNPRLLFNKLKNCVHLAEIAHYHWRALLAVAAHEYASSVERLEASSPKRALEKSAMDEAKSFTIDILQILRVTPIRCLIELCTQTGPDLDFYAQTDLFPTAGLVADLCDVTAFSRLPIQSFEEELRFCNTLAAHPQMLWCFLKNQKTARLALRSCVSRDCVLQHIISMKYEKILQSAEKVRRAFYPKRTFVIWDRLRPSSASARQSPLSDTLLLVREIVLKHYCYIDIRVDLERKFLRLGLCAWLRSGGISASNIVTHQDHENLMIRLKHMLLGLPHCRDGTTLFGRVREQSFLRACKWQLDST
jgi:hypothetical protein